MKPMTATEVLKGLKAHNDKHGPRVQRAAGPFDEVLFDAQIEMLAKVMAHMEEHGVSFGLAKYRREARTALEEK